MIVLFQDSSGLYPVNFPAWSMSSSGVKRRADYRAADPLRFKQVVFFEGYRHSDFVRFEVCRYIDVFAVVFFQLTCEKIDKGLNVFAR